MSTLFNRNTIAAFTSGCSPGVSHRSAGGAREESEDRSHLTRTPIEHVHPDHRRKPNLRSRICHVHAATRTNSRELVIQGIVNKDGTPGPKVALAKQWQAIDTGSFSNSPKKTQPYSILPDINTDGAPTVPFAATAARAQAVEPALPDGDYYELASGGHQPAARSIDSRFPSNLPQCAGGHEPFNFLQRLRRQPRPPLLPDVATVGLQREGHHRANPSGCQNDLFPWVETSVGAGANGAAQPANFTDQATGEGATRHAIPQCRQG